jgi:hypothetical protein
MATPLLGHHLIGQHNQVGHKLVLLHANGAEADLAVIEVMLFSGVHSVLCEQQNAFYYGLFVVHVIHLKGLSGQ